MGLSVASLGLQAHNLSSTSKLPGFLAPTYLAEPVNGILDSLSLHQDFGPFCWSYACFAPINQSEPVTICHLHYIGGAVLESVAMCPARHRHCCT